MAVRNSRVPASPLQPVPLQLRYLCILAERAGLGVTIDPSPANEQDPDFSSWINVQAAWRGTVAQFLASGLFTAAQFARPPVGYRQTWTHQLIGTLVREDADTFVYEIDAVHRTNHVWTHRYAKAARADARYLIFREKLLTAPGLLDDKGEECHG